VPERCESARHRLRRVAECADGRDARALGVDNGPDRSLATPLSELEPSITQSISTVNQELRVIDMTKAFFITGAARGFGRHWCEAALARGDSVAAAARSIDALDPLVKTYGDAVLPLQLDVTDREAGFAAVQHAASHFGRLDVLVNNAGYGHFGAIEELSESDVRTQLETNFFGALWLTQAALPIMREQGAGHIIQVSSYGGVTTFPIVGAYAASKWALEGLSQTLAQEVSGFGINVTLLEPGPYATDWAGSSARASAALPAYDSVKAANNDYWSTQPFGDPAATRDPLLALVDAPKPPLRAFFGSTPLPVVQHDYESRLTSWNEWQDLALQAQGNAGSPTAG
jgi:NAD(P)-dependent dehydrogenase (short-subunit alcohol dehydrogenase family)